MSEQSLRGKGKFKLPRKWWKISPKEDKAGQAVWDGGVGRGRLGKQLGAPTAFRLKVGDAMHDDVVEEQGLVVHLDAAREEPAEVMDVPGRQTGSSGAELTEEHPPWSPASNHPTGKNPACKGVPGPTSSGTAVPQAPPCPHRSASWQTYPEPGQHCGHERADAVEGKYWHQHPSTTGMEVTSEPQGHPRTSCLSLTWLRCCCSACRQPPPPPAGHGSPAGTQQKGCHGGSRASEHPGTDIPQRHTHRSLQAYTSPQMPQPLLDTHQSTHMC